MTSLFTTATNDQSIYFLYQIFGTMESDFPSGFQVISTLMSSMFQTINTVALVLGSIMITYTTIIGVVKTAAEGEFLGKQWNSLWVPLRAVMGISALFPTAAGYSLLQIMMMWFIVQGVGAADTVWTTVLNYLSTHGTPYGGSGVSGSSSSLPNAPTGSSLSIQTQMSQIFQMLACRETLIRSDPDGFTGNVGAKAYYCYANPKDAFCTGNNNVSEITSGPLAKLSKGIWTYQFGPQGACGSIQFPDPATYLSTTATNNATPPAFIPVCAATDSSDIMLCAAIKAEVPALSTMIDALDGIAQSLAEGDHQYIQFWQGAVSSASPPPSVPPAPTPTPTWINNYCQANNISESNCCTSLNAPNNKNCGNSTNFPEPFVTNNGNTDHSSATPDATQNVYYPYYMVPITGAESFIQTIGNTYMDAISTAVNAAAPPLTGWMAVASQNGWLYAGAYYFQIASMSGSVSTAKMPPLIVQPTDPDDSTNPQYKNVSPFRSNYQTAQSILNSLTASTQTTITAAVGNGNMGGASGLMGQVTSMITSAFMNMLTGSSGTASNPLVAAQQLGEHLISAAEWLYAAYLIAGVALATLTSIDFMGLGTGDPVAPGGAAGQFLISSLMILVMSFVAWAFSFGGMLAVYLPLVPYIIFTFSAIGWFTAVLEAMVAAPFVALGILSPGGQHEMLGRAEPGVLILLNTFLRPTLLVFGMMGGMLLAPIAVQMINSSFQMVMFSIDSSPGVVETFIYISSYTTFVITAMNKCFALIYLVPERVLLWIGGQGSSSGEAESLGAVKGSAEKASSAAGSGAAAAGGQLSKTASMNKGRQEEKDKENKKAAAAGKVEGAE